MLGQPFSDVRLRFLRNTFLHILQIFADKCLDFRDDSEYHTKHRELDSCPYTDRIVKGSKLVYVYTDQLDGIEEGRNVYGILRANLLECRWREKDDIKMELWVVKNLNYSEFGVINIVTSRSNRPYQRGCLFSSLLFNTLKFLMLILR